MGHFDIPMLCRSTFCSREPRSGAEDYVLDDLSGLYVTVPKHTADSDAMIVWEIPDDTLPDHHNYLYGTHEHIDVSDDEVDDPTGFEETLADKLPDAEDPLENPAKRQKLKDNPIAIPPKHIIRRSSVVEAERCGISASCVRRMKRTKAPQILFSLLSLIFMMNGGPVKRSVHGLDMFYGVAKVEASFLSKGLSALGYDMVRNPTRQNILHDDGMATLLVWALMVIQFGYSHWGTLCSSWIWMCRSVTERSFMTPLGRADIPFVAEGNMMVSRMVLVWHLLAARDTSFVLEQPASTLMHHHPRVQQWSMISPLSMIHTWMGAFGHNSAKPTRLFSNKEALITSLQRQRPSNCSDKLATSEDNVMPDGPKRVNGNKHKLKESQEYTPQYAAAAVAAWEAWNSHKKSEQSNSLVCLDDEDDLGSSDSDYSETDDRWPELQLGSLAKSLAKKLESK